MLAYIQLGLSIFSLILLGILLPVWKRLNSIQDNHLTRIEHIVEGVDKKLDKHLQFHLEHPW